MVEKLVFKLIFCDAAPITPIVTAHVNVYSRGATFIVDTWYSRGATCAEGYDEGEEIAPHEQIITSVISQRRGVPTEAELLRAAVAIADRYFAHCKRLAAEKEKDDGKPEAARAAARGDGASPGARGDSQSTQNHAGGARDEQDQARVQSEA